MNWDVQQVVLIDYWWGYRGISIGKPSLPNGVVLSWNDIVTSSGGCFLLYRLYIDSALFYTIGQWIETLNKASWWNFDEVKGESVLVNQPWLPNGVRGVVMKWHSDLISRMFLVLWMTYWYSLILYYETMNWDVQHGVLIEYWWSCRGINIGKPW